jgi:hypothetical protein
MTRISGSGRSGPHRMAYFIRRFGDDCAVFPLHPDDREEVIAGGLTIGAAEDLYIEKIEALPSAAPALSLVDAGPAPAAPERKKHGGRQLAFRF